MYSLYVLTIVIAAANFSLLGIILADALIRSTQKRLVKKIFQQHKENLLKEMKNGK